MSALAVDVVKRGGKRPTEQFDSDKLHRSLKAACLSVRTPEGHATDAAAAVCDIIIAWCDDKTEITTADIRHKAAASLATFQPEAAYIYEHHKVIM